MTKYIDADKLRQAVLAQSPNIYSGWETAGVLNLINKQPAADVKEVVRGKWVKDRDCFVCSNCRAAVSMVYPSTWAGCPYCLTDMREVE